MSPAVEQPIMGYVIQSSYGDTLYLRNLVNVHLARQHLAVKGVAEMLGFTNFPISKANVGGRNLYAIQCAVNDLSGLLVDQLSYSIIFNKGLGANTGTVLLRDDICLAKDRPDSISNDLILSSHLG